MNIIRIINSEKIPLIIAALIYVSTIGLVSPHILIFVMLLICLAQKRLINKAINKDKTSFEILLIIVFLSLFNEIIGVFAQHVGDVGVIEIIPYSVADAKQRDFDSSAAQTLNNLRSYTEICKQINDY